MIRMAAMILAAASLAACEGGPSEQPTAKVRAAASGDTVAQGIIGKAEKNAEQENIAKRLSMTINPGQIGFVALFNQAGAPIAYYGVRGKITSSGKRLTNPNMLQDFHEAGGGWNQGIADAPSDDGTWGSSDPYVYFWTTEGQYVQWNGPYLYSDKPFRLRVEPLVISVENRDKEG